MWAQGDVVVATDQAGAVWRSEDAGKRWTKVFVSTEFGLSAITRGGGARLHVVGFGGVVLASDDLGRSFRTRRRGGDAALVAAWAGDGALWAVGMDRILRADDAGGGELVYAGPKRERDMMFTDVDGAEGVVWASHWSGVYRSRNGGETWEIARARDAMLVNGICATSASEAVIVAHRGRVWVGRG